MAVACELTAPRRRVRAEDEHRSIPSPSRVKAPSDLSREGPQRLGGAAHRTAVPKAPRGPRGGSPTGSLRSCLRTYTVSSARFAGPQVTSAHLIGLADEALSRL